MADQPPPFVEPYPGYLEESRVGVVIGVTALVVVLAFLSVVARLYTRAGLLKQMGPDDWVSIVAFLFIFACGFAVAYNVQYGFGRHIETLSIEDLSNYLKCFYISIVLYNAALAAIKATFLLQYYRVLAVQKAWKRIYSATLFIIGGWAISQVFVQLFICKPLEKFWDVFGTVEGTCIPNIPQWYINAGGNIATDIAILLLPLPALWSLKLRQGQKMVLLGIFCLGFFTVVISAFRIKFLKLSPDATWDNVESGCWSVAELCSGIICACLPTLRPLAARYFPSFAASGHGTSAYMKGYYMQSNLNNKGPTEESYNSNVNHGHKGTEAIDLESGNNINPHSYVGVGSGSGNTSGNPSEDGDPFGMSGVVAMGEKEAGLLHHSRSIETGGTGSDLEIMYSEDLMTSGRKSAGADEDERSILSAGGRVGQQVGVTTEIEVIARPDRAVLPTRRGIMIERDVVQVKSEI